LKKKKEEEEEEKKMMMMMLSDKQRKKADSLTTKEVDRGQKQDEIAAETASQDQKRERES
jgi:hypothetical protein